MLPTSAYSEAPGPSEIAIGISEQILAAKLYTQKTGSMVHQQGLPLDIE